ncbi:MAG: hypothetical protein ABIK91_03645 [Pseudomonadota bacterium]|nr:hypothetical protein [Pseudomonadota bacterium]
MAKRDEFTLTTIRIMAERAGQRCSNPGCGRSTAGPSDGSSGESTQLGKAAHISAAAEGGPRYDPKLSPEQRSSQENGIWLCAECADRVDKRENEVQYPVELLRSWKKLNESATGTDFASIQNRAFYPVRKLTLIDFAGVQGEATINFGALTIFNGTSKLNRTVGELLRIFSDRERFERTRQPRSGSTSNLGRIPITEDKSYVITVSTKEPRNFPQIGKIRLSLSDSREVIICAGTDDVSMSIGDTHLPVFSAFLNVVSIGVNFHQIVFESPLSEEKPNTIGGLSRFFGISVGELKDCIKGVPSDRSVFGYSYEIQDDSELYLKISGDDFYPLGVLSSGQQNRFVLDVAIKIALYSAKVKPTVLTIDQSRIISLDQEGWATFLEWVERRGIMLPFQVVVDRNYRPSEGNLSHAMCYDVIGTDMAVTSFRQLTWNEFKK